MTDLLKLILGLLASLFRPRAKLEAEILMLRQQINVLRRRVQNAYVERLIGSIRRECLDHMIVFGEAHLRRIVGAYAGYYNEARTHRSLNKDAPFHRAIERLGAITSQPILGGLHHQYCRI
jgi:transposase InsO family protein